MNLFLLYRTFEHLSALGFLLCPRFLCQGLSEERVFWIKIYNNRLIHGKNNLIHFLFIPLLGLFTHCEEDIHGILIYDMLFFYVSS